MKYRIVQYASYYGTKWRIERKSFFFFWIEQREGISSLENARNIMNLWIQVDHDIPNVVEHRSS